MLRPALLLSLTLLPACAAVVPVPIPLPKPAEKQSLNLIGREPAQVTTLLGTPALDRTEGRGRQLQFANGTCVLDVFFYPDRKSGRVAATYVEARNRSGQALVTQACVDSLAARS